VLIAYLGLQITRRHRALPDAQALWQFWCDLRARPNRDEIEAALEKITRIRQPKTKLRRVPDARVEPRVVAEASVPTETRVVLDVDDASNLDAA
jgi:hypothetical protein